MKRNLLYLFLILSPLSAMLAQNPIQDGGFENWSSSPFSAFEEPISGWWATLNPLNSLGGPVTVEKTSDAHAGSYAALLTTKQYGTLLLPGILLSGDFNVLAANFIRGQPYTGRPINFKGWYKYSPVMGDSAAIAVQLVKWNAVTQQRDTVGEVGLVIYQGVSNWTEFDMNIDYFSQDQPDSLVVVATSSAGADQFLGQIGSQLWIDDFSMDLTTPTSEPTRQLDVVFKGGESWEVEIGRNPVNLHVLDGSGRTVHQEILSVGSNSIENAGWSEGLYLLRFTGKTGNQLVKKIILVH